MKRAFLVSIKGNITNGEVIDAYVYAKNKESLFFHLQTTILCNKQIEIFDVEENIHYTKEEFIFSVTLSILAITGYYSVELEKIDLTNTREDSQLQTKRLIKEFKRRTKIN